MEQKKIEEIRTKDLRRIETDIENLRVRIENNEMGTKRYEDKWKKCKGDNEEDKVNLDISRNDLHQHELSNDFEKCLDDLNQTLNAYKSVISF